MNDRNEQLLRREYSNGHDDPNPGPLPHQTQAALVGQPLAAWTVGTARAPGRSHAS
ncbi:hypothetical protein [Streptomyces sp. NPDC058612]|uniref:hypothetical protein n=1 Tax=Streptomyces sp. NPDC058612 TaxID=3346555 RepID=UPI00364F1E39